MKSIILILVITASVFALDNGLGLTPPMGWLSWEWFRCEVDCKSHPTACIDENLFVSMIDTLVDGGFRKAGYKQINIDDCWMSWERNSTGFLSANATRFPRGIKWLSNYAHSKNVELGIYEDFGTYTCQGYPGSMGYIEKDAALFGEWEVDSLKLDGCYAPLEAMHDGYTNMSKALNKTGRPILYACSWPAYEKEAPFPYLEKICNLWRPYTDIEHTWNSLSDIIKHWGDVQTRYQPANGPGHWVDPDMLTIGSTGQGLGENEYKTQMALWSMWAAPLYMSHDLRSTSDFAFKILTNDEIIAIDQDVLGVAAHMFYRDNVYELWARPLFNGDYAVAVFNKSPNSISIDLDLHDVQIINKNSASFRNLEEHQDVGSIKKREVFHIQEIKSHATNIYRVTLN